MSTIERSLLALTIFAGVVFVAVATEAMARRQPLALIIVAGALGAGCLIASGRVMLEHAESIAPLVSVGKSIYLLGLAIGLGAGGIFVMWAGFHSPIDPVPVLGGALLFFAGFIMLVVWARARRP